MRGASTVALAAGRQPRAGPDQRAPGDRPAGERRPRRHQTKTEPIIRPEYAYMITSILSNDQPQATFGCGACSASPAGTRQARPAPASRSKSTRRRPSATRPTGDTWSVGYTTDIAVGVWIGNGDNSRMKNMYSTTIAAPLWHDVMLEALKGKTPARFHSPRRPRRSDRLRPQRPAGAPGRQVPDGDGPLRRGRAGRAGKQPLGRRAARRPDIGRTSARPASPARFRAGSAIWRTSI